MIGESLRGCTLGASLYTLFTIMTLEGWTNDVVNPVMEKHPYALLFFIPFIVITTFWVLNLFIGIIVNVMQEEHEKAAAAEREAERGAEREMMHEEATPIVREVQALRPRSPRCARGSAAAPKRGAISGSGASRS